MRKLTFMLKIASFLVNQMCMSLLTNNFNVLKSCLCSLRHQSFTVFSAWFMLLLSQMWRSAVGHSVDMKVSEEGDDWETDPDFEVLPGFHLRMLVVVTADPFSPVSE